eukprot:scaffold529_cov308-Pinguiococcus_pyrenoidosus.AAC.55
MDVLKRLVILRLLLESLGRDPPLIEADELVDLIGDHQQVMLLRDIRDGFELGPGKDRARRVVRRVDNDDAGVSRDGALQGSGVQSPALRHVQAEGHGDRNPS